MPGGRNTDDAAIACGPAVSNCVEKSSSDWPAVGFGKLAGSTAWAAETWLRTLALTDRMASLDDSPELSVPPQPATTATSATGSSARLGGIDG